MMMAAPPPQAKPGFYARPSAAVERGGGFYVPGLEGSKLRLAAATVLSVGLVLNRLASPAEAASSQLVSEALGTLGLLLLFAQVAAQSQQEREQEQTELRAALAARIKEERVLSPLLLPAVADRAKWAAETLLRLTPALGVVWVGAGPTLDDVTSGGSSPDGDVPAVLLRFGRFPDQKPDDRPSAAQNLLSLLGDEEASELQLDTAAAPPERAPEPLPRNSASVLLHRCGTSGVLAIASERPDAFTAKHRQRLSLVAPYVTR